ANGEAGIGDAGAVLKPCPGMGETHLQQHAMRRTPFELAEDAGEMKEAHTGVASQVRERELVSVVCVDHRLGPIHSRRIPGDPVGLKSGCGATARESECNNAPASASARASLPPRQSCSARCR